MKNVYNTIYLLAFLCIFSVGATGQEEETLINIYLEIPGIKPPAVQVAILDHDPMIDFKDFIEKNKENYYMGLEKSQTISTAKNYIINSWNTGIFKKVSADDLSLIWYDDPIDYFLDRNGKATNLWIVTKMTGCKKSGQVCWCICVDLEKTIPSKITLTDKNVTKITDLEEVFRSIVFKNKKNIELKKMTSILAMDTDDPRVFGLSQPCLPHGLSIDLVFDINIHVFDSSNMKHLILGSDYTYDENTGKITLLIKEKMVEGKSRLIITGVPKGDGNSFHFYKAIEKGSVKVILGEKVGDQVEEQVLEEGKGFEVDYANGIVRILDPDFNKKDKKHFIKIGKLSIGNMVPKSMMSKEE